MNNTLRWELIEPTFNLIKADADDNIFADCAIAANAELIVTNDSHFDVLKEIPFPKVEICTLQLFSVYLDRM